MSNLKVLVLDSCSLIDSSIVMSVSKYPKLEVLSFYKCPVEDSIAYFSLAATHGFKKLKVLDVRLSGLGDFFLKSMISCSEITGFYFQNRGATYIKDVSNRYDELEASGEGEAVSEEGFERDYDGNSVSDRITDRGTMEFHKTFAKDEVNALPTSFLYTDPYGPCTCGYMKKNEDGGHEEVVNHKQKPPIYPPDAVNGPLPETDRQVGSSTDHSTYRCNHKSCNRPDRKQRLIRDHRKREKKCYRKIFTGDVPNQPFNLSLETLNGVTTIHSSDRFGITLSHSNPSSNMEPSTSRQSEATCSTVRNETGSGDGTNQGTSGRKRNQDVAYNVPKKRMKYEKCYGNSTKAASRSEDDLGTSQLDEPPSAICENVARESEYKVSTGHSSSEESDEDSSKVNPYQRRVVDNDISPSDSEDDTDQEETETPPSPRRYPDELVVRLGQPAEPDGRGIIEIYVGEMNEPENEIVPEFIQAPMLANAVRMINFMLPNGNMNLGVYRNNLVRTYNVSLKRLSLRGYDKVTDVTLGNVRHLNLDLLDLTYTNVTKSGILDFLTTNPNCRVLHRDFCVCRPKLHF